MNLFEKAGQMAGGAMILAEWIGNGGTVVSKETAQHRANVCLKCAKHDKSYSFAEILAATIKRQLELKRHLELRVRGEKTLHACGICGCAMRLKIWLPLSHVKLEESEQSEYPDDCWLKTENQTPPTP